MPPMLLLDDSQNFDFGSGEQPSGEGGDDVPGPGTLIAGGYRIIRPLGTGSMGVVVLAHDEVLDRDVAIKFVRSHLLTASFRRRFVTEARAMARVSHPNVVQIHAFGENGSTPYFVTEYVSGPTLEQWLAKHGGPVDLNLALQILEELCAGVAAIHGAGAVHRDIKPSNILLDENLHPRIADLGLAAFCRDDQPSCRALVGTPAYMAPEIPFGREIDRALRPRADIYSLGCVAYELLTGHLPFVAAVNLGMLLQHATAPPVPPSQRRPDLPKELDEVLLRALCKDPAQRTPGADALRHDLLSVRERQRDPVRILVAEDDDDFRQVLELFLATQFPYADIECVGDGASALAAVERAVASIAIIDLQMPGMDGLELTRQLRTRESSENMPIIVLTASGGPQQWKQLASLGANRFLVKPIFPDDVAMLIRRVLAEQSSAPRTPRMSPPLGREPEPPALSSG